jgi:hypothetical protein
MWVLLVLVAIPIALIIIALLYDGVARKRGWRVRDAGEIGRETREDRLDHEAGRGPTLGPSGPAPRDWYTDLHDARPDRPDQ